MSGQLLSVEKFKVDQCDGGTPNVHVANFKEIITNQTFYLCVSKELHIWDV